MQLKSILAASALVLSFGSAIAANEAVNNAAAQPGNTTTVAQADAFKQLDTNKDKFIDQKEASASSVVSQVFNDADTNKDGKLSAEEFNAAFKTAQ